MLASTGLRGSTFAGQSVSSRRIAIAVPCRHTTVSIEAAHKKGAGSTKNGRDSESKRRGVKVFGGQPVKAGGIIYRQTGSTVSGNPGDPDCSAYIPAYKHAECCVGTA